MDRVADDIKDHAGKLHELDKSLATHLESCAAAHRAIDVRLGGIDTKMDEHFKAAGCFRSAATKKIGDIQKLVALGIVISAILQGVSSEQAIKIGAAVLKALAP